MRVCWTEFRERALEVELISRNVEDDPNDYWVWNSVVESNVIKERTGFGFLVKKNQLRKQRERITHQRLELVDNLDLVESQELDTEDDVSSLKNSNTVAHFYDYHIVYSTSYQVPVLYFNAYHQDGSLLDWEEIWNDLPENFQNEEKRWNLITQNDHPVLGIPFYFIHPCETAKLVEVLQSTETTNNRNVLLSWLSVVAPVVGLPLSISYHVYLHSNGNTQHPNPTS